MVHYFDFMVG